MRSLLTKLVLFRFFNDFILLYPVYILLFQENGISSFQISMLLVIWSVSTVILEIPTGILADNYSRKNLLIIGRIFKSLAFLLWLGGTFYTYAFGFILFSIAGSLMSGTFDAFVYDELKAINKESMYERVASWLQSANMAGVTLALFIGGYIAELSYKFVFIQSIVMPLIAALILFSIKSVHKTISTEEKNYGTYIKGVFLKSFKNIELAKSILLFVLALGAFGAAEELFPLVFHDIGVTESGVGILFGFIFIFYMLGNFSVTYITKLVKVSEVYLVGISGVAVLVWAIFFTLPMVVFLFIASFMLGYVEVRLIAKIQKQIKSHERATILSIKSLLSEGFTIVITLIMGLLLNYFTNVSILWVLGISLILSGVLYVGVRRVRR